MTESKHSHIHTCPRARAHTHNHTHTHTQLKNEETCPYSKDGTSHRYRKNVHIASKRYKKEPLYCISAALSQLIAYRDILAIKK